MLRRFQVGLLIVLGRESSANRERYVTVNNTLNMNMTNKLDHIRHTILDRLGSRWDHWANIHAEGWNLNLWERVLCRIDTLRDHRDEALLHTVNWLQHHYHSLLQLLASVLCVIMSCSGIVTFASLAYGNGPIFLSSLIALIITGVLYRYTESSLTHNQ